MGNGRSHRKKRRYLLRVLVVLLLLVACDVVSAGGFMGRFLCFHGKGSSGALLRERLSPLTREVDLVCVDAPHRLGDGYAWWHLPPGERSFTTPVFDGWAETVEYVRKVWAEQGPFDGMLGFSQGAILIAALVALGELRPGQPLASCRRLVLCGAALPGPFRSELADLRAKPCHGISALHTIGRQDDINPPEQAREVAAAVGGEIFEFEGTHKVPMDEAAMSAYRRLLDLSSTQRRGPMCRDLAPILGDVLRKRRCPEVLVDYSCGHSCQPEVHLPAFLADKKDARMASRALRLAVKSGAVPPGEEGVVRIEAQGRSRRGRYSVATPRGS
eukprot:g10970.t2